MQLEITSVKPSAAASFLLRVLARMHQALRKEERERKRKRERVASTAYSHLLKPFNGVERAVNRKRISSNKGREER